MKSLEIYLTFNGNCKEAIDFYAEVFGGEITIMNTFAEMPPDPEHPMPDELKDQVMHCTLQLKPGVILMASDSMEPGGPTMGNNFTISVVPESKEEVDSLCAAMSAGGEVTMPPADTFWGAYFGMCRDKFNVNWMFNYGPEE